MAIRTEGVLPAPPEVVAVVDQLFCRPESARYGPYERLDDGVEVIDDTLFRFRVLNRAQRDLALQVFMGLGAVGGQLWEQEARVLLRISAVQHPSLPEIVDGAYDEVRDLAFVVTQATADTLDSPGAVSYLRERRSESVRQLALLADALALLHGQGLMHRNLWPGAVDASLAGAEMRLRLARFEMSVLLSNMLRRSAADPLDTEEAVKQLFLGQGARALAYFPPERLALLLGDDQSDTLETDRSDVFGLGAIAWEWFVDDLPLELEGDEGGLALKKRIDEAHGRMRAALARTTLPPPLQNLLRKMLDPDPRTRLTSAEVVDEIARRYDALVAGTHVQTDAPPLVAFMPIESERTIYRWGWIEHDPASDEGRAELQHFIERDLRGSWLTLSPQGAEPFADSGERAAMREARYVLLGRQAAWFCVPYRRKSAFGTTSEAYDDVLLIKYVVRKDRARSLEERPFKQRLSIAEAVPFEVGEDAALEARRRAKERPSWKPLLDAVGIEPPRPDWEVAFESAFEWLLELQQAELQIREYAFVRETENGNSQRVVLRFDKPRDETRVHRSRSGPLSLLAAEARASFGEFFDEPVGEDGVPALLQFRPDSDGRPDRVDGGVAVRSVRLDDEHIEIQRSSGSIAVPREGWLRLREDLGTETALRREREASAEFLQARGLLGQLHAPRTIRGLRHRWRDAGSELRGGGDQIVKDILVSQPFFALHGPPGTGKTTVVAHAVEAFLRDERSARILVSAQSNHALDNLALRITDRLSLENEDGDLLALRITSSASEGSVHPRLLTWRLEEQAATLARRVRSRTAARVAARVDAPRLREVLGEWASSAEESVLELQDRLRRGANLVFATCLGATKQNVDAVGGFGVYDWVIVEEAAKAWPTELAIPLVRGLRWTLVGDHHQLPAHRRDDVERVLTRCAGAPDPALQRHGEARAQYVRVFDMFGTLFDGAGPSGTREARLTEALGRLTTQFRMRPPIARVVSRAFYGGDDALQTDDSADVPADVRAPRALRDSAVVWIDTEGTEASDEPAWANPGEAAIVRKVLEQMDPAPRVGQGTWSEHPLAVLTPWRAQMKLLGEELEELGLSDSVSTVHAFQGREADVVVASLVRDKRRGGMPKDNLGFASQPELANVMLSRARRLLVLVGNYDHFNNSGVSFWELVCASVSELGRVVPAAEI